MKKRISSSLLVAMLAVGSTGMLVSCSDYDDDITNLQEQIDKLATADELASQISTMTSAIQQAKDEAIAQANAANQVAAAAQQAADNAQATAEGAQQVADAAAARAAELEANGATKAEVEAAQRAADAAQQFANQAKADADAAIAQLQEALDQAVAAATEAVQNAQTTADEAKTAADAAQAAAEKAFADAEAAIADALQNAQDYTDTKAAENAQAAAEALAAAQAAQIAAEQGIADAANALAAAEAAAGETAKAQAAADLAQDAADSAQQAAAAAQAAADQANAQLASLTQSVANAATKAELQAAQDALNDAIAAAQKAATDVANTAKTAADAAQATADQALSVANGAAASIKTIEAQINNETTGLAALNTKLQTVSADLAANTKDLNTLKAKVDSIDGALKKIIGEYSTMVTSVSLYASNALSQNFDLEFKQVVEKGNKFPASAEVADKQLTFTEGYIKAYEASVVVRVSPTNAVLTKENISLLNSQGADLSELVECTKVEKYNELLTRAAGDNGLWTVTFKLKDGYDPDAFKAAVEHDGEQVVFAVAVKNTELNGDDRRVVSAYDLTIAANSDLPNNQDFYVQNNAGVWKSVNEIHNRWGGSENGTPTSNIPEYSWLRPDQPAVKGIYSGSDQNAADRFDVRNENRTSFESLAGEVDKAINIRVAWDKTNNTYDKIAGFYVTIDSKFAVESAPSELNAWNSYTYENVGKFDKDGNVITPAKFFEGNTGSITIKNLNGVSGDIIGFRLYAVNLDGTLVDPDGRAFYVAVGDAQTSATLTAGTITATTPTASTGYIAVPEGTFINCDHADAWVADKENPTVNNANVSTTVFGVTYYNSNKQQITNPADYAKIRYVKFSFTSTNPAKNFVDGETFTQTIKLYNNVGGTDILAKTITATMTKTMPTSFPSSFRIKPGQEYAANTVRPFMEPAAGWSSFFATEGSSDLSNVFDGLTNSNYKFVFKTSKRNGNKDEDLSLTANTRGEYILTVAERYITDTPHDVEVSYLYKGVSSYKKSDGSWVNGADWEVDYANALSAQYACWDDDETYKWTSGTNTTLNWTAAGTTRTINGTAVTFTNSRDNATFGGNLTNLIATKQIVRYVGGSAKMLNEDKTASSYFTVSMDPATGDMTFVQSSVQVSEAPYSDVPQILQFKVEDVYGHEITVELKMTVRNPSL